MAKKKFSPDWDFVVSKPLLTFNGKVYNVGEPFDKKGVAARRLQLLFEFRKIKQAEGIGGLKPTQPVKEAPSAEPKPDLTVKETIAEASPTEPEIVGPQKGGWFKVMLGDEQIGDSTRDRDEAETIVLEWMEENA